MEKQYLKLGAPWMKRTLEIPFSQSVSVRDLSRAGPKPGRRPAFVCPPHRTFQLPNQPSLLSVRFHILSCKSKRERSTDRARIQRALVPTDLTVSTGGLHGPSFLLSLCSWVP